jgi:hypothetical protein
MPKKSNPLAKNSQRDPNDHEKKAMAAAYERYNSRTAPLEYKVSFSSERLMNLEAPHSNDAGHFLQSLDTFGTVSSAFQARAVAQLASVMRDAGQGNVTEPALNAGLAAVAGIAPQNEIEAMLAVQMVAAHDVAMTTMRRLASASDPDQMEKLGTIATKMMRTYTTQLEALAKLRRGGEQTVRVEHVHVYQGGQAIVGNVQGGTAPGGMLENGRQPHATEARALAVAPGAPMLCQDTPGLGVPGAGSVGEAPVSNARRRERKRGATR